MTTLASENPRVYELVDRNEFSVITADIIKWVRGDNSGGGSLLYYPNLIS